MSDVLNSGKSLLQSGVVAIDEDRRAPGLTCTRALGASTRSMRYPPSEVTKDEFLTFARSIFP